MGVHNVQNKAEFQAAIKEHDIVVLDAFAVWCGPCKAIAPTLVKYSEQFTNAHFIKVDVDDVPDVAQELGVRAMPTFILFQKGEKVGEVVGMNPPALLAAIEKLAGPTAPAAA
ncbi:thioredoxin [Pseudogymnoascus sp. 05NY08]|nr:thioredoxin [Pseudogymnoascus sp. 05NY08]